MYTLQRIFPCYPVQYEHLYCGYVTLSPPQVKRNIRWFVSLARTSLLLVATNLRQTVHPSLSGIFLLPHYLPLWGGGGGIPITMAYTGRLRLKGEPFSGFRYMKGQGFYQLKYMKVQGNRLFRYVKKPKRAYRFILWL